MAQRYGGQFSPDGNKGGTEAKPPRNPFQGQTPSRAGGRANFLFLAPFPLFVSAFLSDPVGLATKLGAFGILMLAAWLTRAGLLAEDAYHARKVARRPAIPRKMFGAALTGIGLCAAGFSGGLVPAVIFGVLGAALHGFAFGLDPMRDKGMEGIDTFQQDRVARAVDEAEKHLAAMEDAIKRAGDRQMMTRVQQFQGTVRDMLRTIEEDPRDLTSARKYLVVYLQGARDATIKFADIYARTQNSGARDDYDALLNDLEQNFAARNRKMLLEDRSDLTVEIDVLRERLQREGVRLDET